VSDRLGRVNRLSPTRRYNTCNTLHWQW